MFCGTWWLHLQGDRIWFRRKLKRLRGESARLQGMQPIRAAEMEEGTVHVHTHMLI